MKKGAGLSPESLEEFQSHILEFKPYYCDLCDKSYGWNVDLDRHIKSCTGFNDLDTSDGSDDEEDAKLAISGNDDELLKEVSLTEDVIPKEDQEENEQKEPLDNVDATDDEQDSEPISSTSQRNDSSDFTVGTIFGFFVMIFLLILINPNNLRLEKQILSEKILMTKELIKGIEYPNQIIRQMEAILDYDFIEHGVMKNFQEEETVKAIFKHSYNDIIPMEELMKLSCTDDYARIYIAGTCSKEDEDENMIQKCKALYEKCQMI